MTPDPIPPERHQHDRITRAAEQLADTAGMIGLPWRVETLLERLQRQGDIEQRQRAAGEEFARLFQLAHLDPLKAADLHRETSRSRPTVPHGADRARHRIQAALDALGGHASPCGSAAWHILGCETSMHAWALRGAWNGRNISPHAAKGILAGSLGVLAGHFGL